MWLVTPKAEADRFTMVLSGIDTAFSMRRKRAGRALAGVASGSAIVTMFGFAVSMPSMS